MLKLRWCMGNSNLKCVLIVTTTTNLILIWTCITDIFQPRIHKGYFVLEKLVFDVVVIALWFTNITSVQ